MKTSTAILLILIGALASVGAEGPKRLLSIFEAHRSARAVPVPKEAGDLRWMADLWVCVDRALRTPAWSGDSFPHLQTFDLRDREGHSAVTFPSQYGDGVLLAPLCSLRHAGPMEQAGGTNVYIFNFYKEGLTFGPPGQADFLYLKRDPNNPPRWFIFEHQDSGDVLLFQRSSNNAVHKAIE